MLTKENIIDNVAYFSSSELAQHITNGLVTFEELCEEPDFSNIMRKEVKTLLETEEDNAWKRVEATNTIEEYDSYLRSYPEGRHRQEAREAKKRLQAAKESNLTEKEWEQLDKNNESAVRKFMSENPNSPYKDKAQSLLRRTSRQRYAVSAIKSLKNDIKGEEDPNRIITIIKEYIANGSISVDQLYDEIKKEPNLLSAVVIEGLEKAEILTLQDLEEHCRIGAHFLRFIANESLDTPVIDVNVRPINSITPKTTEIYFWGIPSSGKTCALGSIISEARYGGYVDFAEPDIHCQGYEYMTKLSQIFNSSAEVFKLPEGTQADEIYEMSFTLKKHDMDYPVTFIDLAGETIHSMFLSNSNLPLNTKQKTGLDIACKILKGNGGTNRKIHFFVLEYNGHNKTFKDLTQDSLLTGAMAFIKDSGIFKTETDAIYLLVTKADLTGCNTCETRNQAIGDYLKKYYGHIYNGLKRLCVENEINDGEVDIIPFSLGEVCLQTLCRLDKETASTVVELILSRAKGFKTGKLAKLINKLKK